ncbi:hypothetical protein [Duncaniella dubosii]|uniref:hypothetical protein n=1 Tax=Duncaniella dubosii TaxID=2518971 RepID=UPI003F66BD2F
MDTQCRYVLANFTTSVAMKSQACGEGHDRNLHVVEIGKAQARWNMLRACGWKDATICVKFAFTQDM